MSAGGEGLTAVEAEERRDATVGLEPGLIDIEVDAVDSLDLECHMLAEDFGNGSW